MNCMAENYAVSMYVSRAYNEEGRDLVQELLYRAIVSRTLSPPPFIMYYVCMMYVIVARP